MKLDPYNYAFGFVLKTGCDRCGGASEPVLCCGRLMLIVFLDRVALGRVGIMLSTPTRPEWRALF